MLTIGDDGTLTRGDPGHGEQDLGQGRRHHRVQVDLTANGRRGDHAYSRRRSRAAAQAFHGHLCHGMVMGVRMARLGCRELGIDDPQSYRDLVVYVEMDRCASDAVSVVAGVTLGKRRLKWVDYGKMAATFVDLASGRAVRVAPQAGGAARRARHRPDRVLEGLDRRAALHLHAGEGDRSRGGQAGPPGPHGGVRRVRRAGAGRPRGGQETAGLYAGRARTEPTTRCDGPGTPSRRRHAAERDDLRAHGRRGSGKSIVCARWPATLPRGLDVAGILTERSEAGQGAARRVVDLRSGESRPFGSQDRRGAAQPRPGPTGEAGAGAPAWRAATPDPLTPGWEYDSGVFAWANEVLRRATPCDLLVVDEVGPLELLGGRGWAAALEVLRARDFGAALVVCRPGLLDELAGVPGRAARARSSRWISRLETGCRPT